MDTSGRCQGVECAPAPGSPCVYCRMSVLTLEASMPLLWCLNLCAYSSCLLSDVGCELRSQCAASLLLGSVLVAAPTSCLLLCFQFDTPKSSSSCCASCATPLQAEIKFPCAANSITLAQHVRSPRESLMRHAFIARRVPAKPDLLLRSCNPRKRTPKLGQWVDFLGLREAVANFLAK